MKKFVVAAVLSSSLMTAPVMAQEAPVADPFTSTIQIAFIPLIFGAAATIGVLASINNNSTGSGQ